ncbi:MAG: hypothetical protein Q9181_000204 [Wetmoreana brouardii]
MAEFSDKPMTPPPEQYYGFFPGRYTTAYLESYVDDHIYAGQTIRDRIRLNCTVKCVVKLPDSNITGDGAQWEINCSSNDHENRTLRTSKLIDATGMTSQPHIPHLEGSHIFKGKTLHHKSFGQEQALLLDDPSVQNICIIGGAKSAADVAYACAMSPLQKKIHWVIREDGNGPAAFFAAPATTKRYKNSNEGFYNRFLASFLPNRFGNRWGWLKWLLQRTRLGRWYTKRLWDGFDKGLRGFHEYQREEGKEMGFANLEYDTPRTSLEKDKPLTISVDILVYCTGWLAKATLFPPHEAYRLGLPVALHEANPQAQSHWQNLEKAADATILSQFPSLKHPPAYRKIEPRETPFRLYKAMAPPADETRSIVFLGKMVVGNNFRTAEAQALWAVAYLDGRIHDPPTRAQMEKEIAETVAWDRRRYLNKGELGSWFYFDVVDYSDALLEQLKLSSHQQKGLIGNLMEPCFAADFSSIGDEYKRKYCFHGNKHRSS